MARTKTTEKPLTAEDMARMEQYKLLDEVEQKLKKAIDDGTAVFDARGHFASHKHFEWHKHVSQQLHISFLMSDLEEIKTLKQQLETKQGDQWVKIHDCGLYECWDCGERVRLETNGRDFRIDSECKFPGGVPPIEFDLNVPSGIMIVANDLRDKFRIVGDWSVNATVGQLKVSLAYAGVGMAHCFVGNTCPGMFRIKDANRFVIGVRGEKEQNPVKNARQVASICTDLWWFSIVDGDEFERRYNRKVKDIKKGEYLDVVKCKPGLYHFKHVHHRKPQDAYPCVYTYIHRKGKAKPVQDFNAEWLALDYTAGQIVADAIHGYPMLYGCKDPVDAAQRVADHILCTIGNGYEAHPNGWLGACPEVNTSIPPVEIPEFNRKYHWYPLSDYSYLACAAGLNEGKKDSIKGTINLNPSFLDMAFKVARSIVEYGVDGTRGDEKQTVAFAKKCLAGLRKRYPDFEKGK